MYANPHPIWSIVKLRVNPITCRLVFKDISESMDSLITTRLELIQGLVDSSYSNGRDPAQCMAELHGLQTETAKLVNAYDVRIKQLLDTQGKGN